MYMDSIGVAEILDKMRGIKIPKASFKEGRDSSRKSSKRSKC